MRAAYSTFYTDELATPTQLSLERALFCSKSANIVFPRASHNECVYIFTRGGGGAGSSYACAQILFLRTHVRTCTREGARSMERAHTLH